MCKDSVQLYFIHRNKQGVCQIEETKKHGPNEGTEQNPRKTDVEIAILSYAVFKTLVVRMPKDLVEYSKSIREEMKATLREIKKNPQDINSEGKEAGIQINDLEHKEEINIQPEQNEETRIQKKFLRKV